MSVRNLEDIEQYLTFRLDGDTFALDISQVREVLDIINITRVPRTPEFMRGVINLRGNVVPVVDMRLKLGMTRTEESINTCIIIVEVRIDGDASVLGALADSVQEVIELEQGQIEPSPKIGTRLRTEFIRGMGKQEDHFIIILDIDKVFSTDEIGLVTEAGTMAASVEETAGAGAASAIAV